MAIARQRTQLPNTTVEDLPKIVALGTTPPPITGMTLVSAEVIKAIQEKSKVDFFNWSTGLSRRGFKFRLARFWRIISSLIWLTKRGRVSDSTLYLVANSKSGLYLTAAIVWVARRLGYKIYLHHHSYLYIDKFDRRMAWIDHEMGQRGVHVVHTQKMAEDFTRRYRTQCNFECVYPSIISVPMDECRATCEAPIRLGYLSNLQFGKGLDLAIGCFCELRRRGRDVTLTLAGAVLKNNARRYVQRAVDEYPGLVEYIGPAYDEEKRKFFQSIDIFLFPTRSESWGLVLHEAMAAGVPVITFDRGCIKTVVGAGAGVVLDPQDDFITLAADAIELWANDNSTYVAASQSAVQRAIELKDESRHTLDHFVASLLSNSPCLDDSQCHSKATSTILLGPLATQTKVKRC